MEDRESAVLLGRHGGSRLGGRRRRTVLITLLGGLALAAAALVVLVTLASTGTAGVGGRVALEGIDTEHYESGHKLLYRKIKDLYSWKLDWALGAGPFGASSATFDDYLDRLKTFASDAGKVAGHMQVKFLLPPTPCPRCGGLLSRYVWFLKPVKSRRMPVVF
jgi:hypothetical protein